MTMQRRHFELIAEVISHLDTLSDLGQPSARYQAAHAFAHKLRSTNPNFNEARFLRACGVEA